MLGSCPVHALSFVEIVFTHYTYTNYTTRAHTYIHTCISSIELVTRNLYVKRKCRRVLNVNINTQCKQSRWKRFTIFARRNIIVIYIIYNTNRRARYVMSRLDKVFLRRNFCRHFRWSLAGPRCGRCRCKMRAI